MRPVGLLSLLVLWHAGVHAVSRPISRGGEGHLPAVKTGRSSVQEAFNELVYGAEQLHREFHDESAAVNQARTAFLLCASCAYTGPGLEFFAEMFGLDNLIDRQYIVDSIFPAVKQATRSPAWLSVGVRPYTTRYEYILKADGATFDTIEYDPTAAVYGSSQRHFTDKAQNIDKHVPEGTYDVILCNGVLGWGIDSPQEISEFYFTQARVLKSKGYLIIGYNPHIGTNQTGGIEQHFKKASISGLPTEKSFNIEWKHQYEFYQKI